MCTFYFFLNSSVTRRLLPSESILQGTVKAEVRRDSPGAVLSTRLRLLELQSEDRAGGDGDPVVCCRPDTDRPRTKEQTEEDSELCFWSAAPPHRWCPPSQFFPPSHHYLARLGFVSPGLRFSGRALLLYFFLSGDGEGVVKVWDAVCHFVYSPPYTKPFFTVSLY